jgi:hypothetical protein
MRYEDDGLLVIDCVFICRIYLISSKIESIIKSVCDVLSEI